MISIKPVLKLEKADVEGIGNKARNLARFLQQRPLLFSVPNGAVLLPEYATAKHHNDLLKILLAVGPGPYAVRSCGLEEDGLDESLAGKFHTELFVEIADIPAAVSKVRDSYGNTSVPGAVIVQEMVVPDYAGVLFTRSPENYGISSCEFCKGTADNLVSGKIEPLRADFGRWSGQVFNADKNFLKMLSRVFLVGLIIEEKMGHPQDIEWAYEKQRDKLYIIQSRNITSQLYRPEIADEQQRIAHLVSSSKFAEKKKPVFRNAAVREVVLSPTRMTRDLVERLYQPSGALGRGLQLLGLPAPKITQPYVTSIFGRLYENIEVEKKIFGFSLKLLLANKKLVKKIKTKKPELKTWLIEQFSKIAPFIPLPQSPPPSATQLAASVLRGLQQFVETVYPYAYSATLVAQMSRENSSEASLTSQMMRDLSKLHHTGKIDHFLLSWGLRSRNDYELSEPRFCEDPRLARQHAAEFAGFPWARIEFGDGFTHLKEVMKDKAIQWLYPWRKEILRLEATLGLDSGTIFTLTFAEIASIADNSLSQEATTALIRKMIVVEQTWSDIRLGDEIRLEDIELLTTTNLEQGAGLKGKMVSVNKDFSGIVCTAEHLAQQPPEGKYILMAPYLEPQLVAHFPKVTGCLVDVGGTLSHAAIVAREFKLPILVMPSASTTISEGTAIAVKGDGTILIATAG